MLKGFLELLTTHSDGEHELYICPECGQMWQRSIAWNWGNKEYLFQVPPISVIDWSGLPYVQPDELLIFVAVFDEFLTSRSFVASGQKCKQPDCGNQAICSSVFCLPHHIASLQRIGNLPKTPAGRWFEPYTQFGPDLFNRYVAAKQP